MASDYTENVGLANPAPGDCNWDNDWHRNQWISDVCLGVLNSTNRVVSGGLVSLVGGLDVTISAGSANIGGSIVSWPEETITLGAASIDLEYLSNWIFVDAIGEIVNATEPPSGDNFAALAVVDVSESVIMRSYDIRALQTDASIIPAVEKILSDTGIVAAKIGSVADDPDLGLWVEKCAWTSWENETLNTSTRGATRKFPKKYLYVAKSDTVTIYDLVDPNVPMWMVFDSGTYTFLHTGPITAIAMVYGELALAKSENGISLVSFITDSNLICYGGTTFNQYVTLPISGRNNTNSTYRVRPDNPNYFLADDACSDIAMTVLDGNDYPTIGVATEDGISFLDGPAGKNTVASITDADFSSVIISSDGRCLCGRGNLPVVQEGEIPTVDITHAAHRALPESTYLRNNGDSDLAFLGLSTNANIVSVDSIGSSQGLTLFKKNTATPEEGMVNFITDEYQSGWQVGDIKLATLADTTEETIGVDTTTEHIVNGTFDTDTSGWAALSSAILTVDTQRLLITAGDNTTPKATQGFATVTGQVYELSLYSLDGTGGTGVQIGTTSGGTEILTSALDSGLTQEFTFKATSTETFVSLFTSNITGRTAYFDNVSVKAVQNLVENGEFSRDDNWTKGTGWTISGGVAVAGVATAGNLTVIGFTPKDNTKYLISYDIVTRTLGTIRPSIGGTGGAYNYAVETHTEILETVTGTGAFFLQTNGAFNGTIDNIVITELTVPDRSYNNNPLQVVGQLEKTPVADGSELVAFSGFDDSNYITQSHTDTIDIGTGDFCIMGWAFVVNPADTATESFMGYGIPGTRNVAITATPTQLRGYIGGSVVTRYDVAMFNSGYHFVVSIRESGVAKLYYDGVLVDSAADTTDLVNTDATVLLGTDQGSLDADYSHLTLWRLSETAPTADKIKEIYEDEKRLFYPNAKCTLTESQVVCHSHDEDSDTLKAGVTDSASSHHVDTFQGLVNIESEVLLTVPVSVDHTANSKAVTESTQVAYNRDAVDLKEIG